MDKCDEFLALQFSQGWNWKNLDIFFLNFWSMDSWFGSVQRKLRDSVIHSDREKSSDISGTLCSFGISCPSKIKGIRKSDPQVYTMQKGGVINRGQVKQTKKPGKYNLSHRFAIFHMNFSTAGMTGRSD